MDFIKFDRYRGPYLIHNSAKHDLVYLIALLNIDAKLRFKMGMTAEANILQSFDARYFLEMMANLEKSEWTY